MREIVLEVNDKRIVLNGHGYALDIPLPVTVDANRAAAKFSSKKNQLSVVAPVIEA